MLHGRERDTHHGRRVVVFVMFRSRGASGKLLWLLAACACVCVRVSEVEESNLKVVIAMCFIYGWAQYGFILPPDPCLLAYVHPCTGCSLCGVQGERAYPTDPQIVKVTVTS